MTVWLVVLGVGAVACGLALGTVLRRRRRANPQASRWRPLERIIYAVLAVVSIVVGLKLLGVW
ncbi:hypothetical protein [Leifsonia sp. NPDC077715]|uniref:hypothetical protein n=1 Tax=Leifsonia sp. NPDC077715 TaxID=3155539 RepID=UPI00343689E6